MAEAGAGCVLVVDDDSNVRSLLSRHLQNAGYESSHPDDGIQTIEILRNKLPTVIISDLQMPRMTGWEFIGIVCKRFPNIPVIVFSGSIPTEFRAGTDPDRSFAKKLEIVPELLRAVDELAQTESHDVYRAQVAQFPVRTVSGLAGHFTLTCTDCLRPFKAENTRRPEAGPRTAICAHCDARVPFMIESTSPMNRDWASFSSTTLPKARPAVATMEVHSFCPLISSGEEVKLKAGGTARIMALQARAGIIF
jgi:CheY-like chemotaxis protein